MENMRKIINNQAGKPALEEPENYIQDVSTKSLQINYILKSCCSLLVQF